VRARPRIGGLAASICAGLVLAAVPAAGQADPDCTSGPGAAFGVTAYQCANCGVEQRSGTPTAFQFFAEPVVLEVEAGSALRPGDIVEAVDGKPITTRAGAHAFTYPSRSRSTVTVRRDGTRRDLAVQVADACRTPPTPPTPAVAAVPPTAPTPAVPPTSPTPSVAPTPPTPPTPPKSGRGGRFGFALGCLPSCTHTRASDGTQYYRHDGPPPVVAVREGGPADRAGMRVGDRVTHVDGLSIVSEAGGLRFLSAARGREMRLTLDRGGRAVEVELKAP
jgi:membrane-associated protease RseP (regulator of RpoE activity)